MSPSPRAHVPPSPDVGAPPPEPAAAPPPPAGARPRTPARVWLRRLLVVVGALTLLLAAVRLAAWILIPVALERVARAQGLDLTTEDVSISLLGGEVQLSGVRATARDGAPRVLSAEHVRADLALLPLLRGDVVLARVEVDGVDAVIDFGLRDHVELMAELDRALRDLLRRRAELDDPVEAAAQPETTGGPLRLDLPVEVRRLVVRHLRVRVIDPFVRPPVDVTLDVTGDLADLEVASRRPLRVALAVHGPGLVERLAASGIARLEPQRLEAALRVEATGLRPAPLRGWLDALGVAIAHEELALDVDAGLSLRPALDDPEEVSATITLDRLTATGDGQVVLAAERGQLELEALRAPGLRARRLELVGVRGRVARDPDAGRLDISGLSFPLDTDDDDADDDDDEVGPVVLRDVIVRDVEAVYHDAGVPGGLTLPVRIAEARLSGVDSRLPRQPGRLRATLSGEGVAGALDVRGDVWLFPPYQGAAIEVQGRGLTLEALGPALADAGLTPALRDGQLDGALRLIVDRTAVGTQVSALVEGLRLRDDGQDLLFLERLDAPSLHVDADAGRLGADRVVLRGPRLALRRDASGALHVGGFALTAPREAAEAATPRAEDVPSPVGLLRWRAQVGRLDVAGVSARFVDEATPGQPTLSLADAGLLVEGLDLSPDPAGEPPARLALWLSAPGVVDRLRVEGAADAAAGQLSVALEVTAEGITLADLAPHLAAAGLEPALEAGRLTASFAGDLARERGGGLRATGAITRARLTDGGAELLALSSLEARGLVLEPGGPEGEVALEGLELEALELPLRLEAGGGMALLGVRRAPGAEDAPTPGADAVRFGAPLIDLPRLELGGARVARVALRIADERRPGDDLRVEGALTVGALRFDPRQVAPAPPTPFSARLAAPGAADEVRLEGELQLAPDAVRLRAALEGAGLTDRFVASIPGLHTQDVRLDQGTLRLEAALDVARDGEALVGDAALGPVVLADRTGELLGLDLARAEGLSLGPDGFYVADLDVRRPRARVVRIGPAALRVAGLWVEADEAAPDAANGAAGPPGQALQDLPPVTIERARVTGLELEWTDLVTTPPVEAQPVVVDLVAHDLTTRADLPVGDVRLVASAPGAVDRLLLGGRVGLGPERAQARLELDARGVRGAGLRAYVPALALEDGRVRGALEVDLRRLDERASALQVELEDLTVHDGERLLLDAPTVVLDAPRLDPARRLRVARAGGRVAFVEVGLDGDVVRVAGVPVVTPRDPGAPPPAPAPRPAPGTPPPQWPLIQLGAVEVVVDRLRVVDEADGRVVARGTSLRLATPDELELLGPPGRERPRPRLELSGALAPLAREVRLRLSGDPLTPDPELELELEVEGLRGQGLVEMSPALADRLDGRELRDGHLSLTARVGLRTRRTDPLDFTFVERGFGARIEVSGLALREGGPRGLALVLVDEVFADIDRLYPGGQRVDVRVLEVHRPRLTVTRVADGWQVGNVVFKPGPEEPPPEVEEPGFDLHVRQLGVVNLSGTFTDRTVTPPFVLPLRGVELDVGGLDTPSLQGRAPAPRPLSFNLLAFSGPVALPPRPPRGLGRLTGAVRSAVRLIAGGRRRQEIDHRPLFDELSARGVLSTYPALTGRMSASVRTFDVRGLIGLAAAGGVDVSDGVVDLDLRIDFEEGGAADARVGAVIEDLSLTEPDDGPIARLLKVPVTLDTFLFLLRDERGRIRLDVETVVPAEGIGRGAIARGVVEAIGRQTVRAGASVPFRVLRPVWWFLDLITPFELFGWRDRDLAPIVVGFEPGRVDLDPASVRALQRLSRRLERHRDLSVLLRHELGLADEEPLQEITRPDPAQDEALVARLQGRRATLLWQREDLAARARTAFAAGQGMEAQRAIARVQTVDADLGRLERALFEAEDRLGSRTDRLADRRARAAARALSEARLAVVQEVLGEESGPDIARRVRLGPARYVASEETPHGGVVVVTPQVRLVDEEVPEVPPTNANVRGGP
ncbi:MAG: DUF748 domain-containing protein [Planctomycetes bacterium]|nr:DUF748 domain-containing protein [Planctomycetota bacterium]